MVDIANLVGVYARHPSIKSGMTAGFTADYIKEINDEGELILTNETGRVDRVEAGKWVPLYKPSALKFLKSVAVLPANGQLSYVRVKTKRVPSYFCEQVTANAILRWYKRVGNFIAPPGLVVVPGNDTPMPMSQTVFQGVSVLPAIAFSVEGDAVLWSLMAFEQGGDMFKDPESQAKVMNQTELQMLESTKDVLWHPENYFE